MTRSEHLQWCKDRAVAYLNEGQIAEGIASFTSDMRKHEETKATLNNGLSMPLIMQATMSNSGTECIKCIEGFN